MKISDKIVQIDNNPKNSLRLHSRLVKEEEFGSSFLRDIIFSMKEALKKEEDGVAIACPQIGIPLQIFVVSESAYEENAKHKPLVFINPIIIKKSKKTKIVQEGCLSVRWIYGKTKRSIAITIKAYDEDGKLFTYGAGGLLAHIFQHEIDHLNGVLFIDHGFDLEEFTEEEIKKSLKENRK